MINDPQLLTDLKRRLPLLDDELRQEQTRNLVEQAVRSRLRLPYSIRGSLP